MFRRLLTFACYEARFCKWTWNYWQLVCPLPLLSCACNLGEDLLCECKDKKSTVGLPCWKLLLVLRSSINWCCVIQPSSSESPVYFIVILNLTSHFFFISLWEHLEMRLGGQITLKSWISISELQVHGFVWHAHTLSKIFWFISVIFWQKILWLQKWRC